MAETELSILSCHCLDRRIRSQEFVAREVGIFKKDRNKACAPINWQCTPADARIKLKRRYLSFEK